MKSILNILGFSSKKELSDNNTDIKNNFLVPRVSPEEHAKLFDATNYFVPGMGYHYSLERGERHMHLNGFCSLFRPVI